MNPSSSFLAQVKDNNYFMTQNVMLSEKKSKWMLAILLILLALSTILLYKYSTRKFNYWKIRKVNYVKPIPILGSLLPLFRLKQTFGEWLSDLSRQQKDDYFGIFVLDQPVLVVQSPKLIKNILQKDFVHFQNRSATGSKHDPIMSNLMFFSDNPEWKNSRSKVTPVFTTGKLKLMFEVIKKESERMVDYIAERVNVANVESKEICAKYSTNVIARCAFSVDAQSFQSDDAEFRNLGRRVFDFRYSTAFRNLSAWFTPNLVHTFNISFVEPNTSNRLQAIFNEVLDQRKSSCLNKGSDLIDIMLEAQNKSNFEEKYLVAHAFQFYLAGFETISSTLSFTLYELCIRPDIQTRLRTEILESIEKTKTITYDEVAEMKYLDMCVCESLRKYPVLPFLDRTCSSNYKLDDDLIIEKGVPVYIPLFGLHYNPELYPDPQKYDPERFEDKTKINVDCLSYIPFGEGPRICIGNRFGLMGVKLGLVAILSKFKLEMSDQTPIPLQFESKSILLQSKVGIPLKFVPLVQ
ncbi:unnamed protein product [Ceutorhynchus assimilis]|uniref:Cytochrome P450 n=1 Tax=Ceutorhynchus assimilis TaxID=467358 RepID=A0A9N9MR99_9CUCU|nr:unnamed protein product [Ceutorhynchus assimilis]